MIERIGFSAQHYNPALKRKLLWLIVDCTSIFAIMFKRIITLVVIILVAWACKKENANYTARFTLLNASPDATGFDVKVAGQDLNPSLDFGVLSDYINVPALTDSIQWKLKGAAKYDSSFIGDIPVGSDFSLLFFDSVNSTSKYQTYFFRDHWQQPASENKAYIRFFPMLVGGDSLNVIRYVNDSVLGNLSGSRKFGDFVGGSSGANFATVDTFSQKMWLYNGSVKLDSINIQTLKPGKSYSVYIVGVIGNTTTRKPKMIVHEHE